MCVCKGVGMPRAPQRRDRKRIRGFQYGDRWRQVAAAYRATNPLCVSCLAVGVTQQTECVDHIVPHRGNMDLFWDSGNWQSLCNTCHDKKTKSGL